MNFVSFWYNKAGVHLAKANYLVQIIVSRFVPSNESEGFICRKTISCPYGMRLS